jgi:hypothetical protein
MAGAENTYEAGRIDGDDADIVMRASLDGVGSALLPPLFWPKSFGHRFLVLRRLASRSPVDAAARVALRVYDALGRFVRVAEARGAVVRILRRDIEIIGSPVVEDKTWRRLTRSGMDSGSPAFQARIEVDGPRHQATVWARLCIIQISARRDSRYSIWVSTGATLVRRG